MKFLMKLTLVLIILVLSTLSFWIKSGNAFNGIKLFVVESDSMKPSIKKGSVVVVLETSNYEVGDTIAFRYPLNFSRTIIHRIAGIEQVPEVQYVTKGDYNQTIDPWYITNDVIRGKVNMTIPYIGYAVMFVMSKVGVFALVIFPLTILIVYEVEEVLSVVNFKTVSLRFKILKMWLKRKKGA